MRATSLGWQGAWQTVVVGGKASSGSITKMAGYVLLPMAHETSEQHTVVAGGVVRPLAVEASHGSIPATGESPARTKAGQASNDGTIEVTQG